MTDYVLFVVKSKEALEGSHSIEMSEDRLSARSITPTHDSPKSAALMWPSAEISKLSGLISLQLQYFWTWHHVSTTRISVNKMA